MDPLNASALDRRRRLKDKAANFIIGSGGIFVIAAIALIFFYLLFEVWPLFRGADLHSSGQVASDQPALYLDTDEYGQSGVRIGKDGQATYFQAANGQSIGSESLPLPSGTSVAAIQHGPVMSDLVGIGLSDGSLLIVKPGYTVSYGEGNARVVTPSLSYPFGREPLRLSDDKSPLTQFAFNATDDGLMVFALRGDAIWQTRFKPKADAAASDAEFSLSSDDEDSSAGGEKTFAVDTSAATGIALPAVRQLILGTDAKWLYALNGDRELSVIRLSDDEATVKEQVNLLPAGGRVTVLSSLQGGISLLVGDDKGLVSQWFQVREQVDGEDRLVLRHIREFRLGDRAITAIAPESRRKGFVAADETGKVGYFFTTSQRTLAIESGSQGPIHALAINSRSETILAQGERSLGVWTLHAQHPDISISSAWKPVWYESYPKPDYVWQSSSGNSDFEAKMSLVPLTFGTFKAAIYAMLLAAPLAICGAMYTATFMAPGLRRRVKPAIELMQALPTVILGFLAGLWLAPTIETNLPGIFSLLILTPLVILLMGFLWTQMPLEKRNRIPEGWVPVLLIVPVLLAGWLSFSLSQPVELAFFGGDVRHWLQTETGLKFDQRNALIVGLTMGFAVIAPIFSIAEDALFAVPRHLTNGSLALGATQWQTLTRVVLPTASPGIFSALMIGLGRAVGETMIVLMATGNTAVMKWNIFEGMRTLSANVAVEMGEAEVGSTHFRMLFLSALVLFVLTFFVNTIAEVVRSRLRKKYGSL